MILPLWEFPGPATAFAKEVPSLLGPTLTFRPERNFPFYQNVEDSPYRKSHFKNSLLLAFWALINPGLVCKPPRHWLFTFPRELSGSGFFLMSNFHKCWENCPILWTYDHQLNFPEKGKKTHLSKASTDHSLISFSFSLRSPVLVTDNLCSFYQLRMKFGVPAKARNLKRGFLACFIVAVSYNFCIMGHSKIRKKPNFFVISTQGVTIFSGFVHISRNCSATAVLEGPHWSFQP